MKNFSLPIRVIVTCLVFAVGIAVGSLAIQSTSASPEKAEFPKNNKGQTYGSAANVKSYADEPDLIEAIGTNGKVGYIFKKDLEADMPKSPEEAAAKAKAKKLAGGNLRYIPLYESDGQTVIGKFRIQSSDPTLKTSPSNEFPANESPSNGDK